MMADVVIHPVPTSDEDRSKIREDHRPELRRPCECGCDTRDGLHIGWAGYILMYGVTIWIKDEEAFLAIGGAIR